MALMRGVKSVFDPHDLMNPGKVLMPAAEPVAFATPIQRT
jgi:hypothetical protein